MVFVRVARRVLPTASSLVIGIAGLLFATHPIHVDAVTSIVGRHELMSGTMSMLSFLCYSSAFKKHDSINADMKKVFLSIILAGVAVMCKEQGITVIAINIAYDIVVVCGLDVPTFLSLVFFGEQGDAKSDNKVAEKVSEKATTPLKKIAVKKASRQQLPLYIRALLIRLAWLTVGLVIIMYFRLSMNQATPSNDEKTNRKLFSVTQTSTLINQPLSPSCQQDGEVLSPHTDQGLLCDVPCVLAVVSSISELRLGRWQVCHAFEMMMF